MDRRIFLRSGRSLARAVGSASSTDRGATCRTRTLVRDGFDCNHRDANGNRQDRGNAFDFDICSMLTIVGRCSHGRAAFADSREVPHVGVTKKSRGRHSGAVSSMSDRVPAGACITNCRSRRFPHGSHPGDRRDKHFTRALFRRGTRASRSSLSYLFIDEAHHAEAPTWSAFKGKFEKQRVVQFTATPFREDGRLLDGQIIYKYPLKRAQAEGYFKPIRFEPVVEFDPKKADAKIAEKAVARLREDLDKGHILMARVGNVKRAKQVYELYKQHEDLKPNYTQACR